MTLANERPPEGAEWSLLRMLRARAKALGERRERLVANRALSAVNDRLLEDIGVRRLEIDLGHPPSRPVR